MAPTVGGYCFLLIFYVYGGTDITLGILCWKLWVYFEWSVGHSVQVHSQRISLLIVTPT